MSDVILDHIILNLKNITKSITFRAHVRACAGLNAIKTECLMNQIVVKGRIPKIIALMHTWKSLILMRTVDSDQAKESLGSSIRGFILLYRCQDENWLSDLRNRGATTSVRLLFCRSITTIFNLCRVPQPFSQIHRI
jgi:hypothetical protein